MSFVRSFSVASFVLLSGRTGETTEYFVDLPTKTKVRQIVVSYPKFFVSRRCIACKTDREVRTPGLLREPERSPSGYAPFGLLLDLAFPGDCQLCKCREFRELP